MRAALIVMLFATAASVRIPAAARVCAPRAHLAMSATHEYLQTGGSNEAATLHEFEGTPAAFGASSLLCEQELMTVAQEAAEQAAQVEAAEREAAEAAQQRADDEAKVQAEAQAKREEAERRANEAEAQAAALNTHFQGLVAAAALEAAAACARRRYV